MQYCRKCKVNINGSKRCCPLCQGELKGTPDELEDVFPKIQPVRYSKTFAIRIITFIAISIILVSLTINMMFQNGVWWSLIVSAAVGCLWATLTMGIIQRKHIFRNITWQLFFISGCAVLWDLCTSWRGWSIDYVIPLACILSMGSMVFISKFMHIPTGDYIVYLALDALYGVVPVIFIFTGCLNTQYPSLVCACCSLVSIAAILLFEGKNILYEVQKKFHV